MRFYPAYVLGVLVIFLWVQFLPVPGFSVSIKTLFANLLLIIHPRIEYVDGAYWFLAELLLMQFATALLLYVPKNYRETVILFLLFICFCGYSFSDYLQRPSSFLSFFMSCEAKLLLGLIIYTAINAKSKLSILSSLLFLGGICLSVGEQGIVVNWLEMAVLMLMVLCLIIKMDLPSKVRPLVRFLGDTSLMWYLVHQVIGYSIIYNFLPKDYCREVYLFLPLLVTSIIAIAINYYLPKL